MDHPSPTHMVPDGPDWLSDAHCSLEARLREAVAHLDPATREAVDQCFGWRNGTDRTSAVSTGRELATLTLLTACLSGGDGRRALSAALACELAFHAAVIHDDLLDHDLTRNGRSAVWSVFGQTAAIKAGNALTAVAFNALAISVPEQAGLTTGWLARTLARVNAGQLLEVQFASRTSISPAEYMGMVDSKAGALAACGCALGAVFAGAGADTVAGLAAFGSRLGALWQLRKDYLGIWVDPALTGRPAHHDLKSRKKTYPVLVALAHTGDRRERLAQLYHHTPPGPLSDQDTQRAAELIELCAGREGTLDEIRRLLDEALALVERFVPDSTAREALTGLASDYAAVGQ
ncbi:polyprenyl synthetase family protein [Streptomyces racemochromogenes]|uniref:Polyprenyl synthetase family protein n=1 Tax=Streptomyces racemochromogenes TaxID=67353 RepID=A0ABW7PJ76_9ACTN